MYKILAVALAGLLLQTSYSWSQTPQTLEPIIVTATKVETPIREVASSVTVISQDKIANKQAATVLDVLRDVPGLDVVRTGGTGQQTSIFLRGANSSHTLVLIDGIEVNDPSNPSRSFDFSSLSTDNIERIEIVRGPGSTLYGSDALGGVIHIITRKGAGPTRVMLSGEGGSYETHQEKLSISGGTDFINYSLVASFLETEGISAANEKDGNKERDGYDRRSVTARLGLTPTNNFDLDFFFRYLDADTDLDNFGGAFGDDPNNVLDSKSIFFRTQARLLVAELWEQKLGISLTDHDRKNRNDTDTANPVDTTRTSYDSRLYKIDWQHNLYLHPSNTLTIGTEYEKEQAKSRDYRTYLDWFSGLPTSSLNEFNKKTAETIGYYIQDQIKLGQDFITTVGLRADDHNRFGTRLTYRITSSYFIRQTGTRLKGTYGTAFKAPTLAQLYENSAWVTGNLDLSPEKSRGWDIGVEQYLLDDRFILGATYFENRFEDLINTPYNPATFKYEWQNVDRALTKGVELTASIRPLKDLTLATSYTFTDTEDRATGKELVRRPRHKYNVNIGYRFLDRGNVNFDVIYVGKRDDVANVKLDSYTVFNLGASFEINEYVSLTGRVENLFDEDYEEVDGFGMPGIGGYIGAQISL